MWLLLSKYMFLSAILKCRLCIVLFWMSDVPLPLPVQNVCLGNLSCTRSSSSLSIFGATTTNILRVNWAPNYIIWGDGQTSLGFIFQPFTKVRDVETNWPSRFISKANFTTFMTKTPMIKTLLRYQLSFRWAISSRLSCYQYEWGY